MVDLQRLELEKKRYRRESVSLFFAVLAFIVSGVATWFAVQPALSKLTIQTDNTLSYLDALAKPGVNDALGSLAYAQSGSPAAEFGTTIAQWRHAQMDAIPVADIEAGSAKRLDDGTYALCLPELTVPLFPEPCLSVASIDYSPEGELLNFTIDGIPTSSLVRSGDGSDLTNGGVGPMRIYLDVAVVSPDGTSETLIYTLNRKRESDRLYPVTFSSVVAEDDEEESLEVLAQYFPSEIGYWEATSAAVQVPRHAAFLFVCWGGVQDTRGGCDWTYGTGMK